MPKNRLAEIIKMRGYTQKAFADLAGTSSQYINAVCSGKLTISIKQLSKFANMLGVPVSELLVEAHDSNLAFCPHCGMPLRICKDKEEKA